MITKQGAVVKYEPTPAGRRRAADLVAQYPRSCAAVAKTPHHVELLTDFIFHPIKTERPVPAHGSILHPE